MNFKQTEIGLILEDWEVVRLGEVVNVDWGNTSLTKKIYKDSGFPAFSAAGQDGYVDFYEHEGEAVIVSAIGAKCGKCFFTSGKWTAIKNTIIITAKNSVDIRFLYYYLNDENKWPRSGSGQPFIGIGKAKLIPIPLPPLSEQKKIAKVLDKIQQAIEVQDRIIEQARNLKKSLMQKLFTEGLYGEEQKETEIGLIPKSWKVVRLKEVVKYMKAGGTPRRSVKEYWNGDIPFIKIEDITTSNKYILSTKERITEKGLKNSSAWIVPPNSILLSMYASIGEVALTKFPLATNQAILAIIPNDRTIVDFLYYCLKLYGKRLYSYIVQTTQKNVNKAITENLLIPLPPLEEQKQIAHILSVVDKKIEVEKKRKQVLKEL